MSARRATPYSLVFFAVDSSNAPNGLGAISWAAGDVKLSKDGAAFANATNNPSAISGVTGWYKVDLTAAEMDAGALAVNIEKNGIEPVRAVLLTTNDPSGTVVTDGSNTASTFKTDRTEAVDTFWKESMILFTSGSLLGQVRRVTGYNGTTKFVTVATAFTAAPSNGDRFVLVNR